MSNCSSDHCEDAKIHEYNLRQLQHVIDGWRGMWKEMKVELEGIIEDFDIPPLPEGHGIEAAWRQSVERIRVKLRACAAAETREGGK